MSSVQSLKNFYHLLSAILANLYFGFPSRKLYIIGVTGTNGKTTTAHFIANIIESAGYPVALSSTIAFWIKDKKKINTTKFTTLSPWQHQHFLKQALDAGCRFVVAETSSHALDQNRVWGTCYDVAVLTNVTREHLDYHRNMAQYRKAKQRLFKYFFRCPLRRKLGHKRGFAVINLDIKNPLDFMLLPPAKIYGYSIKESITEIPAHVFKKAKHIMRARNIQVRANQTHFRLKSQNFTLNIPGRFNIENALAALSVARILKIPFPVAAKSLGEIKNIPGRMDQVNNDRGLEIVIDYALTPDSMEKVGQMFREKITQKKPNNRFIWIFGSCGERDRGKRPIMGGIAAQYADEVIITNEDPYHEDPTQIIEEVFKGVVESGLKQEGQNAFKIMDRREAIKKALKDAKAGDIVLITGKGAEENMKIGDKLIPWNDKRVVQELLEK